jgi:hypothetical protein
LKKSKLDRVGAITVIQPWAEVILRHGKNVENRQRNSHYRGTVAIHASATKSLSWFENCSINFDPNKLDYGKIIGFADLVDVITAGDVTRATKKWFQGEYGLVLSNIVPLKKPVPCKGARGVWTLKGPTLTACLNQLSAAQLKRLREFKKV